MNRQTLEDNYETNLIRKIALKSTPGLVDVEVLLLTVPEHKSVISGSRESVE